MSDTDWQTFVQRMDLTYLAGTRFIHADAQTWTILASAVHLPILNEGLRPMLQREARALFGRSVSLRFVDMATVEGDPRLRHPPPRPHRPRRGRRRLSVPGRARPGPHPPTAGHWLTEPTVREASSVLCTLQSHCTARRVCNLIAGLQSSSLAE